MATVPPKTLGEATRGLLVVLPGTLLPKSVQPHPTRQHHRVFRVLFEAVGLSIQERDITRSPRFSQGSSSARTEALGAEPSACVQRTASAWLRNPISAAPSSCGLCAVPLGYSLAQEFLIFAKTRDVSGERSPNVIGRALLCSGTEEPRWGTVAARSGARRKNASTLAPQCPRKCGELTQFGGIGRRKNRRKTS